VSDIPTTVERQQAFRAIYEAHHAALCAYFARRVARDEVEDLAAETFAVAWRKLPRRLEQPLPWLYAVAGNVLANHRRKASRRGALAPAAHGALAAGTPPDPADAIAGDRGLARAFARLSERDREAICLVAWEGLSIADAARAASCTTATFAVRLSRARARLRRHLPADRPAAAVLAPEKI
jgi:RNA polymerase sigma factor (sigma-70 family)